MRKAVIGFWKSLEFEGGDKTVFSCEECGDRPDTLVIDGVCIGIRLEHLEGSDIFTPYSESKPVLCSTKYQDRQYVGPFENGRKKLKIAAEFNPPTYPKFGVKKSDNEGLNETKNFFKIIKAKYPSPPGPYVDLMRVLSSSSSTTSLLQPYDPDFGQNLYKLLSENADIFQTQHMTTAKILKEKYPHFFKIYENIWLFENKAMTEDAASFLAKIVRHINNVYKNAPDRKQDEYEIYEGEEIYGQFYPNFPLKFYRAKYEIDGKSEQWEEHCTKLWSEHSKFSPGLFLMLYACHPATQPPKHPPRESSEIELQLANKLTKQPPH